ncbi:MAG TPA: acyltransferase [Gemmatimonadales bacterium]|jgi:peptidoglycan/LPS O-acetylase OafA/YrhL
MTVREVRGHIRELDGLRGIAILLVIVHHYWPETGPWSTWKRLPHLGWIGVDLFFVISGLLIAGILLDTKNASGFFSSFYARRALRIFPLYYVVLLASFILIPLLQGGTWAGSEFVRQSGSPVWYLFYQGNLREAIVGHEPAYVLAPLWSLAIEEQFYLLFPLLVFTTPRRLLRRLLVGMLIFAPLFRIATALIWPANERIQYLATPSRVDVLAVGCLLALGLREGWLKIPDRVLQRALLAGLAIVAVVFAANGFDRTSMFGRTAGYTLIGGFLATLVLWAVTHRESASTAWLRWAPLRGLGKICYGVYLLQRPMQVVVGKVLEHFRIAVDSTSLWYMAMLMGVTFATAATSWFAFEKPLLKLKRRFSVSGHPEAAADGHSSSASPKVTVVTSR